MPLVLTASNSRKLCIMRFLAEMLPSIIALATRPVASISIDGCELCADTGNCSIAYRGHPDEFCGNWIDHFAQCRQWCCPTGSTCRLSMYDCRCTYAPGSPASDRNSAIDDWLLWVVAMALLGICCCLVAPQVAQPERQVLASGAAPMYGGSIGGSTGGG